MQVTSPSLFLITCNFARPNKTILQFFFLTYTLENNSWTFSCRHLIKFHWDKVNFRYFKICRRVAHLLMDKYLDFTTRYVGSTARCVGKDWVPLSSLSVLHKYSNCFKTQYPIGLKFCMEISFNMLSCQKKFRQFHEKMWPGRPAMFSGIVAVYRLSVKKIRKKRINHAWNELATCKFVRTIPMMFWRTHAKINYIAWTVLQLQPPEILGKRLKALKSKVFIKLL